MPKKLISVRISEDLLKRIDLIKENSNIRMLIQGSFQFCSRKYNLLESGIYSKKCSTSDIIEVALLDFFEKYNIKL